MNKGIIAFLFLWFQLLPLQHSYAEDCLDIAESGLTVIETVAHQLIKETYERAGLCAHIKQYPPKRARSMLLSEMVDANVWRSNNFIDQHKDKLVVLKTPITTFSSVIIYDSAKYSDPFTPDLFKGRKIGVMLGCPQGHKIGENIKADLIEVPYYEMMVGMMKVGRLDAIVMPYEKYQYMSIGTPLHKSYKLVQREPFTLYHVLSKKNARYAPALDKALSEVLNEKSYDARLKEVFPNSHS